MFGLIAFGYLASYFCTNRFRQSFGISKDFLEVIYPVATNGMGVDYANVFVKNLRKYQYYLPLDDVHVAEHDVSDEAVHVEVLHLRPLEGAMLDVEGHDACRGMEEEPVAVVHILVTAHDLVHAMAEYLRVGVDYQALVTMVGNQGGKPADETVGRPVHQQQSTVGRGVRSVKTDTDSLVCER